MSDQLQNLAQLFSNFQNGEPNLTQFLLRLYRDALSKSHLEPWILLWQNIPGIWGGLPCKRYFTHTWWLSNLVAGEGWFGLEKLHKLTSDTKGSYKLKVTLTSRDWKEYVGYWDWLKVFTAFTRMQVLELGLVLSRWPTNITAQLNTYERRYRLDFCEGLTD